MAYLDCVIITPADDEIRCQCDRAHQVFMGGAAGHSLQLCTVLALHGGRHCCSRRVGRCRPALGRREVLQPQMHIGRARQHTRVLEVDGSKSTDVEGRESVPENHDRSARRTRDRGGSHVSAANVQSQRPRSALTYRRRRRQYIGLIRILH